MVLESKYGSPKIVNDGVTIAKEVELEDPVENIGAKLVRQVRVDFDLGPLCLQLRSCLVRKLAEVGCQMVRTDADQAHGAAACSRRRASTLFRD